MIVTVLASAFPAEASSVLIPKGPLNPIFGKAKPKTISAFVIDEAAVTNKEFKAFIDGHAMWAPGLVPKLFADTNYLKHWPSASGVGDPLLENSPVANVSWFAAKAYCDAKGMRLPTVDEWEYLAQFGPVDSKTDPETIILEWYSKPTPQKLPNVRSTFKNKFGVWDIHGLIWEWNYDFNTAFVTGESRADSTLEKSMFCGAGSIDAANPKNYAAFMRFGFRSSLKGNYTVENLGFRCAKDVK